MAIKLECDICHKDIAELDKINELTADYKVPGRIEHLCAGCVRKLNDKIKGFRAHYGDLMANDVREWLLDLENRTKEKATAKA